MITKELPTIEELTHTILNATILQELYESQLHIEAHLTAVYRDKEDNYGNGSVAEYNGSIARLMTLKSILEDKKEEVKNNRIARFNYLSKFHDAARRFCTREIYDKINKEARK